MSTILGQTRKGFKTAAYQYIRTTDKLPSTDKAWAQEDPICRVKLFSPSGSGTWWIAGFDPETGLAVGVVHLFETEAGDFDMNELVALRVRPFGLPIERDLWFEPTKMSQLMGATR